MEQKKLLGNVSTQKLKLYNFTNIILKRKKKKLLNVLSLKLNYNKVNQIKENFLEKKQIIINKKEEKFLDNNEKKLSIKNTFNEEIFFLKKFIKLLMRNGKKSKSEKILYNLLKTLSFNKTKLSLSIFVKAIKNISPILTVRSVRVKGRSYKVSFPLQKQTRYFIGMKWLIAFCRKVKKGSLLTELKKQILLCFDKKGELIKKKNDLYKLATLNRMYAGYRW
jgi:small subunit ribosomal protein S7